ncbi:MAG: HlyD family secretion protein [Halieaceae bacterium]|jgi:HlyD family secretion protein
MKKRIITIIAVLAIGCSAWFFWPRADAGGELVLYGNIDIREVQLGFRVAGRLQEMIFEEGDAVTKGQLMAALDDKPLRDGTAVAQAMVAEAAARLATLRSGSRPQEIEQARARVTEVRAALTNASQEFNRQKGLVTRGVSSQRLLDAAKSELDQTQARLIANKEALELAVEGVRSEAIDAGEAALSAAQARLEQAKTQQADTQLVAPNDGVILTRAREPGSIVGVGVPVYALSLTDTVYVRAYVAEPNLGRVAPGNKVTVTTDSSVVEYVGQIGFISPRAEFTPKSVETPELRTDLVYRLRIVITSPDGGLRQGMPVTIRLDAS